jgi:hypothetical protein
MEKKPKTVAAIEARWGVGTPEERWAEKVTTVVSFIARLGWATVELVKPSLMISQQPFWF